MIRTCRPLISLCCWLQTLASVVVVLMRLAAGLTFGYTGYVLPQMTQVNTTPDGGNRGDDIALTPHHVALFGK